MPPRFAPARLLLPDRAGRGPRPPPAGIIDSPLGQVQVESADRDHALLVVQPGDLRLGLFACRAGDRFRLRPQALLPVAGDLGGQVQAADAGVVAFQVLPDSIPRVQARDFRLV